MNSLVTVEELAERLPFELDEDDTREAEGALADLSEDARIYGSSSWMTSASTPHPVKNLILRAASRHMKNYEGYTFSRAGDETVQWTDRGESSGTATFTKNEIQMLRTMTGRRSFGTMGLYAYSNKPASSTGYVPTVGGSPFPYFAGDGPW